MNGNHSDYDALLRDKLTRCTIKEEDGLYVGKETQKNRYFLHVCGVLGSGFFSGCVGNLVVHYYSKFRAI
jgi:hypothetical protein